MKRIFSILLMGVTMMSVTSCFDAGNVGGILDKIKNLLKGNDEVVDEVVEEVAYEAVEEFVYEERVYSNSYDGYTNVRKSASAKSTILGKLRNGNDFVVVVGEQGNWYEVDYYGQTGYVHKDYVSHSPTIPVTVDVDAKWLEGAWAFNAEYCIFSNGKYALEHWHGTMEFGKWHLEGDEIVLTTTYVFDWAKEYDCECGNVVRLTINKEAQCLGDDFYKVDIPVYLEEGEEGVTVEVFNELKKEANKYVK